jgi:uncharacterized membrane protein YfcA
LISTEQLLLLVAIVFATSIVGAITGAMSLINVPVLMMMGIAPRVAVATNMFAVTFLTIGATLRFRREGLTSSPLLLPLCMLTLVTSALGAQLTAAHPNDPKLTVLPVLARAVVLALDDVPQLNARFRSGDGVIDRHRAVHLGIATQTEKGLMVPVVKHVEALDKVAARTN